MQFLDGDEQGRLVLAGANEMLHEMAASPLNGLRSTSGVPRRITASGDEAISSMPEPERFREGSWR
jgi:hypothetical protein